MSAVLDIVREDLRELAGYQAAAPDHERLRLHANESPWDDVLDVHEGSVNRYPPVRALDLEARLATVYGARKEQLLVTRGSDDGIDLLVRTFCAAGHHAVVTTPPTFGMYAVAAKLQGARRIDVPLDPTRGWSVDSEAIIDAVDRNPVRLVFLCSPNNPTGSTLARAQVLELCRHLDGRSAIVVDEAYAEFTGTSDFVNALEQHPNLIVLRTLSKAHGLAGVRCGAVLAAPELIELLANVAPPYSTPSPVIRAVLERLRPEGLALTRERVQILREQRVRLADALESLTFVRRVWPSDANFLLTEVNDAQRLVTFCRDHGVLLRSFAGKAGLGEAVRFSVGTPEQVDRLLEVVEAFA